MATQLISRVPHARAEPPVTAPAALRRAAPFSPAGVQCRFGNQGAGALLGRLGDRGAALPAVASGVVRAEMESRLGSDFSPVRVHGDSDAFEGSRALGASSWTHGQNVAFGAGQSAPGRSLDDWVTVDERAHSIQVEEDVDASVVRRNDDNETEGGDDDTDAQYERELAICRSLADPGARARCYERVQERLWARQNGRPEPPVNWRNILLAAGAAILVVGGLILLPEITIPALLVGL